MRNRIKKIKIIVGLTLITFPAMKAQQTVSYDVVNNESQTQNLMIGVSLLDFNIGQPSLSFGGGVDADFYLKRFSFEGGFHMAYYDMKKGIIAATNESSNKLKNYSDLRIGGRFHLVDKASKRKMKASMGTETQGTYTKETFFMVDVPIRKIVALHFGFENYNMAAKSKRDKSITASDGAKLTEWQSGTNVSTGMIYGGFSFINIMKATVRADGNYNYRWYRNIYFDFLYAPVVKVEDVLIGENSYVVQGAETEGFEKSPFGGRFGYSNMAKNVYLRYEIGWLPGLSGRGFFTQATFGFSIVKGVLKKKE